MPSGASTGASAPAGCIVCNFAMLLVRAMSLSGICPTGNTMSTMPLSMACRGMESYSASSGNWARVTPPASLILAMPTEPSEPAPESSTPMACVSWALAKVRKN
ncbi:hypothetical protein D9M71_585150 [compost metagenome]